MKRFWPYGLLLLGIMIIFVGFVYDVLFAGIPFQDPTPAMLATYNFHATIAATIRWVGTGISLLALIIIVLRWGLRFLHK